MWSWGAARVCSLRPGCVRASGWMAGDHRSSSQRRRLFVGPAELSLLSGAAFFLSWLRCMIRCSSGHASSSRSGTYPASAEVSSRSAISAASASSARHSAIMGAGECPGDSCSCGARLMSVGPVASGDGARGRVSSFMAAMAIRSGFGRGAVFFVAPPIRKHVSEVSLHARTGPVRSRCARPEQRRRAAQFRRYRSWDAREWARRSTRMPDCRL